MNNVKKSLVEQSFPFETLSAIAERESWRKEVNRPTSYVHKWWARRLGSIFRGLIIGCVEAPDAPFFERFYNNTTYPQLRVFDPFMGSGTTVTEAVKLGAQVVGSDINPVSASIVRTALDSYDHDEIFKHYKQIEQVCAAKIKKYYKAIYNNETVDVLYYFWVKVLTCDDCGADIPLYKTSVFSKNAYASKKPEAQSVCPHCGGINEIKYSDKDTCCSSCGKSYNPQAGNISGIEYVCPCCGKKEKIVSYARRHGTVISSRMYAKMIVDSSGKKRYLPIDEYDLVLYEDARTASEEFADYIPDDDILSGTNTDQILNYNYRKWRDMFNARQLLAFGILSREIAAIEQPQMRRLFGILMSGTLEFNNMFCSFKGEGTGAVRPLFYNHILKSELMPLEANVWGLPCSSGSFSTLYKTRILRMVDYKENPFELKQQPNGSYEKAYLEGCRIEVSCTQNINKWNSRHPLIMCRDSAHTGLPDSSIDLVLTDPPFFDNVNYSELADFFYVWFKKLGIDMDADVPNTTRNPSEVQDNNAEQFASKLCDVFTEAHRLLTQNGMMVFTYHHSRTEGWVSVYNAICGAGFEISAVLPVKAEMSVSVAIQSAKVPINYDLVFVCRKRSSQETPIDQGCILSDMNNSLDKITSSGLSFSDGDKAILLYGLILKSLSEKGKTHIQKDDIETLFRNIIAESNS